MEHSPHKSRMGDKDFQVQTEQLFDVFDDVNELRSELENGELSDSWRHTVVENHYGYDESVDLTGRTITAINSDRYIGGLIHNLVQGVIFIEYPDRGSHPAPRILIVHNRFNNDNNGKTHVFQSKTVKIDEFNRLSVECFRTFRATTLGFDDYRFGDFGVYYDYNNSDGDYVQIDSKYQLLPATGVKSELDWTNEALPKNIGKQNKALRVARLIIDSFGYAFTNPDK